MRKFCGFNCNHREIYKRVIFVQKLKNKTIFSLHHLWREGYENETVQSTLSAVGYIAIVTALVRLAMEFLQMYQDLKGYLSSFTNYLELSTYILATFAIIPFSKQTSECGIRTDSQWQLGIVALGLSWATLILFIRKFPRFGIYVLMFTTIIKTMIDFALVFILFILGFAFCFQCLYSNQDAFADPWNSVVKTLVMMIGEMDFGDTFYPDEEDFNSEIFYSNLSYVTFVIFCIVMSIVVMNLLVGLAVDDISEVRKTAQLKRLGMLVKLSLETEFNSLMEISGYRRRFHHNFRIVSPNEFQLGNWLLDWFTDTDDRMTLEKIEAVIQPELSEVQEIQNQVYDIGEQVDDVFWRFRNVDAKIDRIEEEVNEKMDRTLKMLEVLMEKVGETVSRDF